MGKKSKVAGGAGSEAPTYHERKAMGYNSTLVERMGKVCFGLLLSVDSVWGCFSGCAFFFFRVRLKCNTIH